MPKETRDVWLKVLIGFMITVIGVAVTFGMTALDKKVGKDVFESHEKHQTQQ